MDRQGQGQSIESRYMKYGLQDKFDKIHGRVIVVIEDNVPHTRTLCFTSSFSRRSSPDFRMGPTRFGFCCCERGLLNVFTISIPSIRALDISSSIFSLFG